MCINFTFFKEIEEAQRIREEEQWDTTRFLKKSKQDIFYQLESRTIKAERRVELLPRVF